MDCSQEATDFPVTLIVALGALYKIDVVFKSFILLTLIVPKFFSSTPMAARLMLLPIRLPPD